MNCDADWWMDHIKDEHKVYSPGEKKTLRDALRVRKVREWGIWQYQSMDKSVKCKILCLIKSQVALRTLVLVSSPLPALQTTVWPDIQRWLWFTAFQDFKPLCHLWIATVPVVQLPQLLFHLNIKSTLKIRVWETPLNIELFCKIKILSLFFFRLLFERWHEYVEILDFSWKQNLDTVRTLGKGRT